METNQPASASTSTPVATSKRASGFGLTSVTFLIGLLLFLLPFVNIKCSSMTIKEVRGFELATGFTIEDKNAGSTTWNRNANQTGTDQPGPEKKDPSTFALVALVTAVLGFILSLGSSRSRMVLAALTAGITAIALILTMIDVRNKMKLESAKNTGSDGFSGNLNDVNITAEFTPWFYFTIILFLAAAMISWRRGKKKPA